MAEVTRYSGWGLKYLPKNLAGGLSSRTEHCWGYVTILENTHEKLTLKSNFPLKLLQLYLVDQGQNWTMVTHSL